MTEKSTFNGMIEEFNLCRQSGHYKETEEYILSAQRTAFNKCMEDINIELKNVFKSYDKCRCHRTDENEDCENCQKILNYSNGIEKSKLLIQAHFAPEEEP